jgi:hypothetical protein
MSSLLPLLLHGSHVIPAHTITLLLQAQGRMGNLFQPLPLLRLGWSNAGNITLNLPANSSFQLTTAMDTGGIHNDFSGSTVGSDPRAIITLKTDNGDIRVQKR